VRAERQAAGPEPVEAQAEPPAAGPVQHALPERGPAEVLAREQVLAAALVQAVQQVSVAAWEQA
jgi:hypothetical protein